MSLYKAVYNPYTRKIDLVRAESAFHMKDPISTYNSLPLTGNNENDTRITKDTDKLYTWSISSSSGTIDNWLEIGSASSIDWSAIANKPSSTVSAIDGAVSDSHTHSNKSTLDSIQEALTTVLKTAYDACVTFVSNFIITGANIDDVLVWNGSKYINKALTQTTGQGITYFLDNTSSGVGSYLSLSLIPTGGTEIATQTVVNNNRLLLGAYNSDSLEGTEINAGVWNFVTWASVDNITDDTYIDIDVYKMTSGGSSSLLFNFTTPVINTTSAFQYLATTSREAFSITASDKLLVFFYARTTATSDRTVSLYHNGVLHYTRIETPIIIRHNKLAGLNVGDYVHLTAIEKTNTDDAIQKKHTQNTDTILDEDGTNEISAENLVKGNIQFLIDGGGSAIETGIKGDIQIPFACTIQEVTLLADQSGSIAVDIWKDTYANYEPTDADSITASAVPTITTAIKSNDATLTGWTTSISAGDVLTFNVDSCTTIERCTVILKIKRT